MKSFLLGGAAGLVASAQASQAADIPAKIDPVAYVKVCSLYGEGFFYIPGTDTCLKIGGWVRLDSYFDQNSGNDPPMSGSDGLNTRSSSPDFTTRSRTVVSFDARSQTEYGALRAYYRGGFELTSGLSSQYANGTYHFERAFVQLGGWTLGRAQSFFDIFSNTWGYGAAFLAAGSNTSAYGTNLVAHTVQFGNGVSASVAIEDGNTRRNALWDATASRAIAGVAPDGDSLSLSGGVSKLGPMGPATNGFTTCGVSLVDNDNTNGNASTTNGLNAVGCGWGDYAAQGVPDIVANLRVDQAWGSAQISGALHQLRANSYGNNFVAASPGFIGASPQDKWGGAINAGIMLNLPWNAGDRFWLEATYDQGAGSYAGFGRDDHANNSFVRFNGSQVAAGFALDGVFACNGGILGDTTTAAVCSRSGIVLSTSWSATAAVEHHWTSALRTSLYASYAYWTPGVAGNAVMCASPLGPARTVADAKPNGAAPLAGCDYAFASWGFGSRTVWVAVKDLDIGFEVLYQQLQTSMNPSLVAYTFSGSGTRASGLYAPANEDAWAGMIRVQRNFHP